MNIEEIQQAVSKLSPDELSFFDKWFKEHISNLKPGEPDSSTAPIEETLKRLKGSLKGKGGMKTFSEERRKESFS